MVEPLADKLAKLREDPQVPNLLFLIKQKKVFEAEEERLRSLCEQDPKNVILEKAYFLIRHSRKACEDCTLTPEDIEKRKIEDEKNNIFAGKGSSCRKRCCFNDLFHYSFIKI